MSKFKQSFKIWLRDRWMTGCQLAFGKLRSAMGDERDLLGYSPSMNDEMDRCVIKRTRPREPVKLPQIIRDRVDVGPTLPEEPPAISQVRAKLGSERAASGPGEDQRAAEPAR